MRKAFLLAGAFLFIQCSAFAQVSGTSLVFPQLADGVQSDGSYYQSLLFVTNLSGTTATCALTTVGVPLSRFTNPFPTTILSTGTVYLPTSAVLNPIASGSATVTCSQPVQATLTYILYASNGALLGMATVFPAAPVRYANIPVISGAGFTYGMAIANPGPLDIVVNVQLTKSDGTVSVAAVPIPAYGQVAGFISQVVSVPSTLGFNLFEMSSTSPFNTVGLMFNGAVFTTLVPAVIP